MMAVGDETSECGEEDGGKKKRERESKAKRREAKQARKVTAPGAPHCKSAYNLVKGRHQHPDRGVHQPHAAGAQVCVGGLCNANADEELGEI